jgi:hypothetical protein
MEAKTRDLALLTGVSLFCTGAAWIFDHVVLGSVFFALPDHGADGARCLGGPYVHRNRHTGAV